MKIDLTVSVGDILTTLVVLTAIIALLLQARSVKLSEKQLNVQVNDVKTLSNEVSKVAEEIKREREKIEKLSIEKMTEYAKQLNYTNHVYDQSMFYYRTNQSQMHEYIMSLNLAVQNLLEEIKGLQSDKYNSQQIILIKNVLIHMAEFIVVSQKWSDELNKISDESHTRLKKIDINNNDYERLLGEEIGRLDHQIEETNKITTVPTFS